MNSEDKVSSLFGHCFRVLASSPRSSRIFVFHLDLMKRILGILAMKK